MSLPAVDTYMYLYYMLTAVTSHRLPAAAAESGEHQPRHARPRAPQAQRRRAPVTCLAAEDPDGAVASVLKLYRQQ